MSDLTWRNGRVTTASELAADPATAAMTEEDCVLFDDGDGAVCSWRILANIKAEYGVTDEDPNAALEKVSAKMARPKPSADELQAIIDVLLGGE